MHLVPIERDGATTAPLQGASDVVAHIIQATCSLYQRRGFLPPWTGYLAVEDDRIVGTCGFAGPPSGGEVEIAYFTLPENEGRGIATRMARALLELTRPDADQQRLQYVAHTLPEHGPSTSVLQSLCFELAGEIEHPEDGRVWKWHRPNRCALMTSTASEHGMDANTETIVGFLRGIGIVVRAGDVAGDSFLPGVLVERGEIVFDARHLAWPGDLLHEAGHIAVTPPGLRHLLPDSLSGHPVDAAGGEVEATAWAYAATVALGLDPAVLFHDGGYHGKSAGLRMTFALGVYPGAKGLADAGMTLVGETARQAGVPPYPHLLHWLRE